MTAPRVALVCSGLGYVNRGFERMTRDLFDVVGRDGGVTLFKGGGAAAPGEIVLRVPRRTGPLRRLGAERGYRTELLLFASRLLPHLVARRIEVVHYLEPYLGNILSAARRRFGLGYTLLFTDSLGLTPRSRSRADVLHLLTPLARDEAVGRERPAEQVLFAPMGIHAARSGISKERARTELGLEPDAHVVLDVAAVNRRHKRVDVLIDEMARLEDRSGLVVAGAPEEPELLELGRERLGDRFRHVHLAPEQTPVVYAAADVFAHTALEEGYGLAVLEAMAAGLPVVVHDSPHFRWLVGDARQLVDFRSPGALRTGLEQLPRDAPEVNRRHAKGFDWPALAPAYAELYASVLARRSSR